MLHARPFSYIVGALALLLACGHTTWAASDETFPGPFPSWANVKSDYGAVGDGQTDDTRAIQKALDDLHQERPSRSVLYFPAGTYRITDTLILLRTKHNESINIAIFGEDPATTTIKWDGPAGGVMLDYGAWYSRLGRLTFDGVGKARTAIAHGKSFVTFNEIADIAIRDVDFGIEAGAKGGAGIAETAVLRCQFLRCAKAAISIQDFNSLDWWVWHGRFEDCGIGVTNTFGAGNFHVYNSLFKRSRIADISIGNTGYFSFRRNHSIKSKAFFVAANIGAAALLTIQGNTILDPLDTPIRVGNRGPVLLLDNAIRYAKSPAVKVNPLAGFVSVGNRFTADNAIDAKPGIRLEDQLVPADSIAAAEPVLPDALPRLAGPVIDLPAGASALVIQRAILQACQERDKRPIVHLPAGAYRIDHTIEIPENCGIQLVGDGGATQLSWAGRDSGPVLRLRGPSRATLRDFTVNGAGKADGIEVCRCDQPGSRIFMEQANVHDARGVGLLADRVNNAEVHLHAFEHSGCKLGVQAIGGRLAIFGGASSSNQLSYGVADGGDILATDIRYETGKEQRFVNLAGRGTFTLNGAIAGLPQKDATPGLILDDFHGDAAFLATQLVGADNHPLPFVVKGQGERTNLLLLGVQVGMGDGYLLNQSPQARVCFRESMMSVPGGGARPVAEQGLKDDAFVLRMLRPARTRHPRPLSALPAGVTDLRVYRVMVSNAHRCIWLRPDAVADEPR